MLAKVEPKQIVGEIQVSFANRVWHFNVFEDDRIPGLVELLRQADAMAGYPGALRGAGQITVNWFDQVER